MTLSVCVDVCVDGGVDVCASDQWRETLKVSTVSERILDEKTHRTLSGSIIEIAAMLVRMLYAEWAGR